MTEIEFHDESCRCKHCEPKKLPPLLYWTNGNTVVGYPRGKKPKGRSWKRIKNFTRNLDGV